jgi:hypothetical protein
MRKSVVITVTKWCYAGLLFLALAQAALAGPNANTSFVLHAVQTQFGPCDISDPCAPPGEPAVEITQPGQPHAIYFCVRNYTEICGFQADLRWPSDWTWLFAISCPAAVLDCFHIGKHTILCSFNSITGGATVVMAAIHMVPGSECFEIEESIWPGGTCVIDCQLEVEHVAEANWGRVCVGPGGVNTCAPIVPIASTTWGNIKSQY